ncbi:MAG: exonuclease [Thaumarchaeota archaeon]|nr:exonuclease [Nitrososphaerota archaeon]MDD9808572.1 exonuclease [Nitrososphaerota archaeon]MDD9843460.1 exonuclease [Nitrososphaerota archaeon]RNJ73922.1 MAG: exonuclease [Thaumarchaeota archaeon S13]
MGPSVVAGRRGIVCETRGREVCLDPPGRVGARLAFVSHAHADHLPASGTSAVSSEETRALAGARDVAIHGADGGGLEMVDAGHILGSRGLLFDDIFYTGDICTRARAFMRGARVPRCRTLITETTFGLPSFSFPPPSEVARRVNGIISSAFERGRPVILVGHQLGKAQLLTHMFGHWAPLYAHDSIRAINGVYAEMGVRMPETVGHTEAESRGLLARGPWVMVAPMGAGALISGLRRRHRAVTVAFSGWAGSGHAAERRGADYVVPLSDHCDFGELVGMVVASGAETVYTTHGYADEFGAHLRTMGIDARPVPRARLKG